MKPRFNLPNQVQMSFLPESDADLSTLHANLEDNIKAEMDETKLRTCEDYSFVTTSQQRSYGRGKEAIQNVWVQESVNVSFKTHR